MIKARIRKINGVWTMTRRPFGFRQDVEVTTHRSHKAAIKASQPRTPGGTPDAQRTSDPNGRRNCYWGANGFPVRIT